MKKINKLFLLYQRRRADLYGAICPVLKVGRQQTSAPFVISKMLGNKEIVYGSMIDLVVKLNNILIKYNDHQHQIGKSLDERNIQPTKDESRHGGVVKTVPEFEGIDSFFHEHEEKDEETIFLFAVYLRSLIEVFGKSVDEKLVIYTYEGHDSSNTISMRELSNILMHNRYLVIRNEYLTNMFSDIKHLSSGKYFGSKINIFEYFSAAQKIFKQNITFDVFLDMIELRLDKVSAQSDPQEIIFLVQNIHSLNKMVETRISDNRFSEMMDLLFKKTTDSMLRNAQIHHPDRNELFIQFTFTPPTFQIAEDLSSKKIEVSTTTNGTQEKLELKCKDLFSALKKSFGKDPLITFEKR